jgi:hypothetical protein
MIPVIIQFCMTYWRYLAGVILAISLFFAWHRIREKIFESGVTFCESAAKEVGIVNAGKLEVIAHDTESMSDLAIDDDLRRLGVLRRAEDR